LSVEVIMPALGLAQETGKVIRWLKAEGDSVQPGDALLEVETDKVTVEIESEAAGVLDGIVAAEGEDVPVGRVIAMIYGVGEERAAPRSTAAVAQPAAPEPVRAPDAQHDSNGSRVAGARLLASPKARRLAAAHGVELGSLAGTGPRGAVRASDVLAAVEADGDDQRGRGRLEPHPRIWQRMAERLTESWHDAPHFFLQRDIDASELLRWKSACATRGESVTLTDLLVALCGRVLANHPRVRSRWTAEGLLVEDAVDIGIAVAVPDGLVVPVIRGADSGPIREITGQRKALVERARAGRLGPGDMGGSVFTVSNLGMFDVDAFRAILNPPEAAILAVGRIRPIVKLVSGTAVERPVMTLTLSCDHRVLDGARAAEFLSALAETFENPLLLLD
jgi:pyruvate dehydrogenase E2 component (dihydrolipoamide acetyltransferase)